MSDLLTDYFEYISESEAPNIFHRWSCLSILGAWLGRRYYFPFGHKDINCNMYVMLMGNAGSRKTTTIEIAAKLIKAAGYDKIAANKTTKEKFLMDLSGETTEDIYEQNLFGDLDLKEDSEILIAAEEFNIFVGNGNIEFLSLLGTLWDYNGPFENKVKNSKSTTINNPTVTILAGNTPTNFTLAFPPEAIGQGIFSRLLLIHGERNGKRITLPKKLDEKLQAEIIKKLRTIRTTCIGELTYTDTAYKLIDKIYKLDGGIEDVRFESYNNRRLTHLLKLCLLVTACSVSKTLTEKDVIYANSILTHAEHFMPKALGEFGKARHSDVSHKLISLLESSIDVIPFKELWKHLHNDLESPEALRALLSNLKLADKLIHIDGKGFLSKRKAMIGNNDTVDFSLLTEEEQKGILK